MEEEKKRVMTSEAAAMQDPRKYHKKRVAQSVKEETQSFASAQDSSLTITPDGTRKTHAAGGVE